MGVRVKQQLSSNHFLVFFLFMLCCIFVPDVWSTCTLSTTHSFFRPRSFSQNMALQYSMFNYSLYHMYRRTSKLPSFSFQTMMFYFSSTNKSSLAKFFFPDDKQLLRVELNNTADISAPQFEIVRPKGTDFKSFISIAPKRRVAGGAFGMFFDLDWLIPKMWLNIFIPLVNVQHDLNFSELQQTGDGIVPGVPNVAGALNNPNWQYGKFATDTQSRTNIDDINFRVGCDWFKDPYGYKHASPYLLIHMPTGSKSNPGYIFEPTMGSGGHTGLGFGINFDYWWWNYALSQFCIFGDYRYTYYFKSDEIRSFDLFNGPFTRYLQTANVDNPFLRTPGINHFTQCVDVIPGNMMEFIIGLHYAYANWHLEWGYNLWWRQRENIILKGDPLRNKVILDIVGIICDMPTSANTAKISQGTPGPGQPVSDKKITRLTNDDFNLDSGAHPVAMSSTAYMSIGADWFVGDIPNFFALSFYYEFGHNRGALEQVGGSFKYGFRY